MERFRSARNAARPEFPARPPHLSLVRAPGNPVAQPGGRHVRIATYNVHRWTGFNGRAAPDPARAGFVISELDADVIALQEVLRPTGENDPVAAIADALGLHVAFAVTRQHKRGELGNAILSRLPIAGASVVDISHSKLERRGALVAQFHGDHTGGFGVIATHLSLVDRTRHRQVQSLLAHPHFDSGPSVLIGDMNAWRQCRATRHLDQTLHRHHNTNWPASFPAAAPVLSLDRIYARSAKVVDVQTHDTPASRRASDHLPVVAVIELADE